MSDKVLERVQRLIALSTSPEVEEARTSAALACQLINAHRLIVVRHERSKPIEDEASPRSAPTRPPARPAPPRPQPAPIRALRIVIMCESYCSACGKKVRLAEEAWLRGIEVLHLGCLK